ncbi:MAG: hypothetical protein GY726_10930 [Proteobacteria bacterium]|nr:hypothetical protein [Pseudomonadota bacterium]MCP4140658.1 hypothetical protein [Chloroflexota bacterium]MCP4280661.1 hypothetical protein [Alteromonas sp.]
MWKYIGKGSALLGVPARDLTDNEVKEHGTKFIERSGLYKKISKKAKKKVAEPQVKGDE